MRHHTVPTDSIRQILIALCITQLAAACGGDEPGAREPAEQPDMGEMQQDMDSPPPGMCGVNEFVRAGECTPCAAGTQRAAGDDPTGDDTTCQAVSCGENQRVSGNTCVLCDYGSTNMAGDDASGADTQCDGILCPSNTSVSDGICTPCGPGQTNEAGDDASGADTQCDATLCGEDERVVGNRCVSCPAGTTNEAGDDASGPDTQCDATLCLVDEYVASNQCMSCPDGATNEAGDDASGADTQCEDACSELFGTTCSQVEQTYIKASTPSRGDQFGGVFAVDGDTLVVGASQESSDGVGVVGDPDNEDASESGAVFVFVKDAQGVWSQQAYIKASNAEGDDEFGTSVDISGDLMVVGARSEDSSARGIDGDQSNNDVRGSGAAYVFERDAQGVWSQQAYLKASNTYRPPDVNAIAVPSDSDPAFFGESVAIDGTTIVVGAPRESSNATGVDGDQENSDARSSGAAYVFERDAQGVWSQQAYLKASNTTERDYFATSLDIEGDRLIVGAPYHDASDPAARDGNGGVESSGMVYVFERDMQGIWSQSATLQAEALYRYSYFGWSVSLDADRLAIGAFSDVSANVPPEIDEYDDYRHGAVYMFEHDAGVWSQTTRLEPSVFEGRYLGFGRSVSLSGDRLLVGAPEELGQSRGIGFVARGGDDEESASGAAYLFTVDEQGMWSQRAYIKSFNADFGDSFGECVALDEDTMFVGAPYENGDAPGVGGDATLNFTDESGAVYVIDLVP